jgi:hypothetical protein
LGSPGSVQPQRAQNGFQKALWSLFGASRPGSAPESPKWLPEGSLELVWGLPARFGPRWPQMVSRRLCGVCLGPPARCRPRKGSNRTPGASVEHWWSSAGLNGSQSMLNSLVCGIHFLTGWMLWRQIHLCSRHHAIININACMQTLESSLGFGRWHCVS